MGAWIEIPLAYCAKYLADCRTPRWVRGLKLIKSVLIVVIKMSHPTMGAWIEIHNDNE